MSLLSSSLAYFRHAKGFLHTSCFFIFICIPVSSIESAIFVCKELKPSSRREILFGVPEFRQVLRPGRRLWNLFEHPYLPYGSVTLLLVYIREGARDAEFG